MVAFVIGAFRGGGEFIACGFALSDNHYALSERYNEISNVIITAFPKILVALRILDTL